MIPVGDSRAPFPASGTNTHGRHVPRRYSTREEAPVPVPVAEGDGRKGRGPASAINAHMPRLVPDRGCPRPLLYAALPLSTLSVPQPPPSSDRLSHGRRSPPSMRISPPRRPVALLRAHSAHRSIISPTYLMATPGRPHGTTPYHRRGKSAETHQKRTSSSRNTSPRWPAFAAPPRSSCCSASPSRAPPPWPRATSPPAPPRGRPSTPRARRPARSPPSRTCRRPPSPQGPAAEAGCPPSRASAPSRGSPCPGWGAGGAGATAGPTAGTRAAAWRPPPPSAPTRAPATRGS
ncbi:hypothetical protein ACQJBY_031207 [Aegilops geniculata]